MLNALQPWHIIVLVVVLIALFGAKRLPDAARGIGKSMRIFKAEAKSLRDEHTEGESGDRSADPVKQQLEQARTEQPQVAPPIEQQPTRQNHTETSR